MATLVKFHCLKAKKSYDFYRIFSAHYCALITKASYGVKMKGGGCLVNDIEVVCPLYLQQIQLKACVWYFQFAKWCSYQLVLSFMAVSQSPSLASPPPIASSPTIYFINLLTRYWGQRLLTY